MTARLLSVVVLIMGMISSARGATDILIEDFESADYGDWVVTGEAFGPGPAQGTIGSQRTVSGYLGERLVNTYYSGDKVVGTLTSPAFTIQRDYINFLVGGGNHPGQTCMNLLVNDAVVRTMTGIDDEALVWVNWDVSDLVGDQAVLQIVDNYTSGWGHINVDHIYQSDEQAIMVYEQTRTIRISNDYLLLPVQNSCTELEMQLLGEKGVIYSVNLDFANTAVDTWTAIDVSCMKDMDITLRLVKPVNERGGMDIIQQSETLNIDVNYLIGKSRQFHINKKYLNFPVKTDNAKQVINIFAEGKKIREFDIELEPDNPDFWVYLDVSEFEGMDLQLWTDGAVEREGCCVAGKARDAIAAVFQANTFPGENEVYKEQLRPQFHLTTKRGWNNDVNGMVYYDGEYHIFWQHNPYGWRWGNMTWGHAVSTDLLHWEELGEAIHPDHLGTVYSGSAVVDENNTTGFQTGSEKPIVAVYTSAADRNIWSKGGLRTQSLAYSNDRGRTWEIYENNPVLGHVTGNNRDPKVFWHEPTGKWVMVLYLDNNEMGFFTSPDLKNWEYKSKIESFYECPEFFEMPLNGNPAHTKWVLYGGNGNYMVGDFDGSTFSPETEEIRFHYGKNYYASQTFNGIPAADGRRIQIAWGKAIVMTGMPFNQMMLFPVDLTLRESDGNMRLYVNPIEEIASLYAQSHLWTNEVISDSSANLADGIEGDLFDIKANLSDINCSEVVFDLRGIEVKYNVAEATLSCLGKSATLPVVNGAITLRMLMDRTSLEIYANDGWLYMPFGAFPEETNRSLAVQAAGGSVKVGSLAVHELKSIWE